MKHFSTIFNNSREGSSSIVEHVRLLERLNQQFSAILPLGLRNFSRIVSYAPWQRGKLGQVVVFASNSAVSAKLRQILPSLLAALSCSGFHCDEIVVKVRPPERVQNSVKAVVKRSVPVQVQAEWTALRDSLTDSPLRDALSHFLSRVSFSKETE